MSRENRRYNARAHIRQAMDAIDRRVELERRLDAIERAIGTADRASLPKLRAEAEQIRARLGKAGDQFHTKCAPCLIITTIAGTVLLGHIVGLQLPTTLPSISFVEFVLAAIGAVLLGEGLKRVFRAIHLGKRHFCSPAPSAWDEDWTADEWSRDFLLSTRRRERQVPDFDPEISVSLEIDRGDIKAVEPPMKAITAPLKQITQGAGDKPVFVPLNLANNGQIVAERAE